MFSAVTIPSAVPSRRRRVFIICLVVAVLVALPICTFWWHLNSAEQRYQEAVAEADRLDPGWRIEELEAKRQVVADEENGAFQVPSILGIDEKGLSSSRRWRWPNDWPYGKLQYPWLMDLPPQVQLTTQQHRDLVDTLEDAEWPLTQARRLLSYRKGRFPITYAPDGWSTVVGDSQRSRDIFNLLMWDATLLVQEGDVDGALASCQACINAGRAIGDEPTMISMIIRIFSRQVSCFSIERSLAQGQASETSLASLQGLLEDEEKQPILLIGFRGDRALSDRFFEYLDQHSLSPSIIARRMKELEDLVGKGTSTAATLEKFQVFIPGVMKGQRAASLKYMNQLVEIAKLPDHEQIAPLEELEANVKTETLFIRHLATIIGRIPPRHRLSRALLKSTIVGLALERYRLANARWPDSLADLAPRFLAKVPVDPFDGRLLRYRRTEDGVVVYSVGLDGRDDGGNLHRKFPFPEGSDVGFRLWDVDKRRQAPTDQ